MEPPESVAYDPEGRLFVADVGQHLFEEVNIIEKGGNYGGNIREGFHCFDPENPSKPPQNCPDENNRGELLREPILGYPHVHEDKIIGSAVIGGYLYEGDTISELQGKYVFGYWAETQGLPSGRLFTAEYEQVTDLVETTVDEHGGLDVIVNNVGIGQAAPLGEMSIDDWEQVIRVNLDGVIYGSKAALPHLVESDGSIVNVVSIFGLVGGPGSPAYSAAKGGVVNLTRTVAIDYASEGVRANVICPGFVEIAMVEDYLGKEQFYDFIRNETPIGRVAQPDEIGDIAAFLASDEALYISRAAIPADGGWTAH